jgi:hypothetical protein
MPFVLIVKGARATTCDSADGGTFTTARQRSDGGSAGGASADAQGRSALGVIAAVITPPVHDHWRDFDLPAVGG